MLPKGAIDSDSSFTKLLQGIADTQEQVESCGRIVMPYRGWGHPYSGWVVRDQSKAVFAISELTGGCHARGRKLNSLYIPGLATRLSMRQGG
jgi:hypothetical protein